MAKGWDDSGCEAVAGQGRAGKAPKGPVMRLPEARNDKPPFGGLTRAGGWPYSRDAKWSDAKIDRGKRSVNSPPQMLGNSGRETNAQGTLNLHRGSQPVGTRRKSGSVNGNGKP